MSYIILYVVKEGVGAQSINGMVHKRMRTLDTADQKDEFSLWKLQLIPVLTKIHCKACIRTVKKSMRIE